MATHADSTRTPLLRQTTGSTGLLSCTPPESRIVAPSGPVSRALRIMLEADPEQEEIRRLRRSIAMRIEADIELLNALDGDPDLEDAADFEPSLCGAHSGDGSIGGTIEPSTAYGDDRELDAGDQPELANEHGTDDAEAWA